MVDTWFSENRKLEKEKNVVKFQSQDFFQSMFYIGNSAFLSNALHYQQFKTFENIIYNQVATFWTVIKSLKTVLMQYRRI